MTELDERVARVLHDVVPQPPRELDGPAIRAAASRRMRRKIVLGPALAAAMVAAVAVGVALAVQHPSATKDEHHLGGPDRVPGHVSPRVVTERVVERLLAAAPTLPKATQVDHPPTNALRHPLSESASPNLVRRTHWWTAPGTVVGALRYIRTHLPPGVRTRGSSGAGGNGVPVSGLSFDASGRQWQRPTVYSDLELLVAVTRFGNGVAIRVDAEAIWLPQRTAAEHIPLRVASVDVVVDRLGSAPTVRRTLPSDEARALAKVVNGLPVAQPGTRFCPMDRGFTDTLTFHAATGDIRVRASVGGCGPVNIDRPQQLKPGLSGGGVVDRALTKALGLPRNYGW